MHFKLSTLVAFLAVAAPALASNAVVDGLNKISKQVAGVEQKADKLNVVTLAAQGPVSLYDSRLPIVLPPSGVH